MSHPDKPYRSEEISPRVSVLKHNKTQIFWAFSDGPCQPNSPLISQSPNQIFQVWLGNLVGGGDPLYRGGRLFRPLLRPGLMLYPHSFCGMYFLYISPSQRKNFGFENSFQPPEISRYFLGFFFSARIEVVLHELRLFCTD